MQRSRPFKLGEADKKKRKCRRHGHASGKRMKYDLSRAEGKILEREKPGSSFKYDNTAHVVSTSCRCRVGPL